jgi:putative ABC transport system substrate-binding protein
MSMEQGARSSEQQKRSRKLVRKKFISLALSSMLSALGFLGALILALSFPAEAQQPAKIPRIGYVTGSGDSNNPGPSFEAFRQGLLDLSYIEGKKILVEYRTAEGKLDRVPGLVAELVQLKPDVLVVESLTGIHEAKQATKTIPIVMVTTQDPVATGIIDSLARPGGNITGVTTLSRELSGKRLELLREVIPGISRVGVLSGNPTSLGNPVIKKQYEAAARALKIPLQFLDVRGPNPDLEGAFREGVKKRVSALITIRGPLLNRYPKQIAELAIKNRLPSMHEGSENVEAGGLMSYAANSLDQHRRAAAYVDKILKGAKPADLPVEQPTKFELIINLKAAKQIGLTIPPNVLARADRVIK